MIETPCDFVYGFDCVLRWRGLEQNKEVMLPHSVKGWTRSRVALVEPGVPDKDRWLVVSTDLRSKSEGEGHQAALSFTQDEWGNHAKAVWYKESHPTCIFTGANNKAKMMYTRFRKNKQQATGLRMEREAVSSLTVKRYAAAIRVVGDHLQFWLPIPPYNALLNRDISKSVVATVSREPYKQAPEGERAERMARLWGIQTE